MSSRSRRNQLKSSERRKVFRAGSLPLGECIADFGSPNATRRERACERLEESASNRRSLLVAGDMRLEMAAHSDNDDSEMLKNLGQAQANWQRIVNIDARLGVKGGYEALQARLNLDRLPKFAWLIVNRQLTPPDQLQKVYLASLSTAVELCHSIDERRETSPSRTGIEYRGLLAQTSVMMLMERFSLQHGGGEWEPFPSYLSQDRLDTSLDEHRSQWDISVFTNYGPVPVTSHKVQVKNTVDYDAKQNTYASDIAVIGVREHLRTQTQKGDARRVILECAAEAGIVNDYAPAIDYLEVSTGKILDALDQAA